VPATPGGGPPVDDVVYLDHAATTPLRPEVAEAMAPYLGGWFGNPSGSHRLARQARRAVDEAREVVASVLGADPGEIVFTSGGTEADNLAVLGPLAALEDRPAASLVCSAVEHPAVLEAARAAAGGRWRGARPVPLRVAPVDRAGLVDLDALVEVLDDDVAVVSVMTANNETGAVQPLDEVERLVRRHARRAVLHTDAVQAAPWLDLAVRCARVDLVSVSAHKVGGPKGSGALVVRRGTPLRPLVFGGAQEGGLRSGTHDVAAIVGLAAALDAAAAARTLDGPRVAALTDRFRRALVSTVPGTRATGDPASTLPGHCHVRFDGVDREEVLVLLDQAGVCASAGAACASGAVEPSHVLSAMGLTPAECRGAVRFTLGPTTGPGDLDRALVAVDEAVTKLRTA